MVVALVTHGIKNEEDKEMKKIYSFLMAIALLVAGVAMTGCNKDNNSPEQQKVAKTYHMSIKASKGADDKANAPKKVLGLDGNTLNATWAAGDEVKVYNVDASDPYAPPTYTLLGTLTAQSAGSNTTLSGDLTGVIAADDLLEFVYNGYPTDYRNQNGTLDYISAHCDLAIASAYVEAIDGAGYITLEGGTADFVSQQAVVKFTIKDKDNNDLPVTSITFTDLNGWMPNRVDPTNESNYSKGSITVTPASATNEIYVAFYNREGFMGYESRSYSISAISGGNPYEYNKTVTFDAGKYYTVTMKMAPPISGRLSGMFTVRGETMSTPAKKVYFSQGNLQKSGGAYQFATNQWDYLETSSGATYDLFQWNDGGTEEVGNNAITNGGKRANAGWRTLTKAEWNYLMNERGSGALWKTARINLGGEPAYFVYGLILAPDVLEGTFIAFQRGKFETSMSISEWENDYASQGCVFLPVKYTTDDNIDADHSFTNAYYWSITDGGDVAYAAEYYRTWSDGEGDWDLGHFRSTTIPFKTNTLPIRLVIDAN